MRFALVLVLALATGCQCGSGRPTCSTTADCKAGQVCSQGFCTASGAGGGSGDSGTGGSVGGGSGGGTGGSTSDGGDCPVACGTTCCPLSNDCVAGACTPKCAADLRCGQGLAEVCCAASDVCYLDACTTPGPACSGTAACPQGSYCDTTLARCLPLGPNAACEFHSTGTFAPTSLWKYVVGTDAYTQVMMTPVVADVNGDKIPDVLANFFTLSGGYGGAGVMRALSGDDGHVLWTTADTADLHVHPPASIAVADLDGSGVMVAVTQADDDTLIALDARTGTKLWKSHDGSSAPVHCQAEWGGPAIANVVGDSKAEVICGFMVFDSTGLLLWTHGRGGGAVGPLTVVADLNHDGQPDVSDGREAWKGDGTGLWGDAGFPGFPAVGDFVNGLALGQDGTPELVVVGAGKVALVNGQTGALLAPPQALPSYDGTQCTPGAASPGNGGPPTIADFDGDGQPEVGVADLDCYTMFKLIASGGSFAWSVVWSKKVQDHSSSVTGSSVFDFDGDGKAEVVYADEVKVHVFNGSDGTEIFTRPHCSGTTYEYPLVVDVNGNGRADMVVPENTYAATSLGCDSSVTPGIQVLHDGNDSWVNTRQIWNQHTYHVTNVCDGFDQVCGGPGAAGNVYGRVPASEPDSFSFVNARPDAGAKPLNDYRQNVQGEGLFNAPDLAAKDLVLKCGMGAYTLEVRVVNQGALGVLPGVKVAFYTDPTPRVLLGEARTTGRLLPGQGEVVSLTVALDGGVPTGSVVAVVDDDGAGTGAVSECHEDNNVAGPLVLGCIN